MVLYTSPFNLWWQPCWAPRKETTGSGTPALDLEIELLESIIHHLGDLFHLCFSEFYTLKNFYINLSVTRISLCSMIMSQLMRESESLLLNVFYFNCSFTTVKIACIKLLIKIFIKNLNVFFKCKTHAFHSYDKAAFTVTVFTNHSVLFVKFQSFQDFPLLWVSQSTSGG